MARKALKAIKYDTIEYTESNINDTKKLVKEAFKEDDYKILIVANKFQTGFDEPLLHTMYINKVLSGVAACNYDNIHELYKRILSNYDFILNITHNELIYDWHEGGVITVVKENNVSKLKQM